MTSDSNVRPWLNRWLLFTAAYLVTLAASNLVFAPRANWHFFRPDIITAIGFLGCGVIMLLRGIGATRLSVAGGFLVEYASLVPLLLYGWNAVDESTLPLSLSTVGDYLGFLLAAIAIQFLGYRRPFRTRSAYVALAGSMVFGYGSIGMISSVAAVGVEPQLNSLGFILMGFYLLLASWFDPIRSLRPLWFNIAIGVGSLTANIALWQFVVSQSSPHSLPAVTVSGAVLYAGVVATICLTVVAHFAQVAHAQAQHLIRLNQELLEAYDATLEGWANALEMRDMETCNHTARVTELTVKLARRFNVSDEELMHIRRGAMLHDIGKIGIPDAILRNSGPLSDDEWQIMRKHPEYSFEMLKKIPYLMPALDIPRYHHEKWDGTGYPFGLKGNDIPLAARLFCVVDVWDALANDRPYRTAWPRQRILDYLESMRGTHFDPVVLDTFYALMAESDMVESNVIDMAS